ncbi:DUF4260 family protein [Jannaschia sp. Os4]|uniref:DUF4260 family protein n=1 Tax=Jannaschia sp. Os4 TaxID=2807617 RepID=UPI0019396833|nr:DUF4260 family protein [Jannaschia sp. Os4]MBM2575869.1 DUF4260 family protein [Jannaschia sp. Os4]
MPVRPLLRAEGAAILILSLAGYRLWGGGWGVLVPLLLLPDVALLAYLGGARAGAWVYNLAHSYVGPAALSLWGLWAGSDVAVVLAWAWAAHCGLDRMLGYGLKTGGFRDTHLGRIGRAQSVTR